MHFASQENLEYFSVLAQYFDLNSHFKNAENDNLKSLNQIKQERNLHALGYGFRVLGQIFGSVTSLLLINYAMITSLII